MTIHKGITGDKEFRKFFFGKYGSAVFPYIPVGIDQEIPYDTKGGIGKCGNADQPEDMLYFAAGIVMKQEVIAVGTKKTGYKKEIGNSKST